MRRTNGESVTGKFESGMRGKCGKKVGENKISPLLFSPSTYPS
jgi:hypothetical protein